VFTSEGICYSFKAMHPKLIFKDSAHLGAFRKVFGDYPDDYPPFKIAGLIN